MDRYYGFDLGDAESAVSAESRKPKESSRNFIAELA
jgi:hypothetical protein